MDHQLNPIDVTDVAESDFPVFPSVVEWGLDQFDAHEDYAPRVSIALGLGGLGLLMSVFASVPPIAIWIFNNFSGLPPPPGYLLQTMIIHSIYLPPVISSAIVVSATFFWYVPIWIRYLVAATLSIVTGILFLALISYLVDPVRMEVVKTFFAAMFGLFVGAGATALIIQMWSPWALSHFRSKDQPLRKLGTRALFELTTITAVSCAIIVAINNDPELETNNFVIGTMLFSAFGIVASLTGICLIQMFLRNRRGRPISIFIPLTLLLGTSLIAPTFLAVQEFGWNSLRRDAPIVIVAAAYGMLLICAVIALHLGWLYVCGWCCISRRADE